MTHATTERRPLVPPTIPKALIERLNLSTEKLTDAERAQLLATMRADQPDSFFDIQDISGLSQGFIGLKYCDVYRVANIARDELATKLREIHEAYLCKVAIYIHEVAGEFEVVILSPRREFTLEFRALVEAHLGDRIVAQPTHMPIVDLPQPTRQPSGNPIQRLDDRIGALENFLSVDTRKKAEAELDDAKRIRDYFRSVEPYLMAIGEIPALPGKAHAKLPATGPKKKPGRKPAEHAKK